MNFGHRNELHAYYQRKREQEASRNDTIVVVVCLAMLLVYSILSHFGVIA